MPTKPAIFINYRRSDTSEGARNLHKYLSGRFGKKLIFFDRNAIESGDVFPDNLRRGVEGCAVLLALIGPKWLNVRGKDRRRRLEDPRDYVRGEIALALELGKKIIPMLFEDAAVPPADRLPGPLMALASCDALTLRGKDYEYEAHLRELVRLLAKVPAVPEPHPDVDEVAARNHKIARWRKMAMDVQLKIDNMNTENQEKLEAILYVLQRHPNYLEFCKAFEELHKGHNKHRLFMPPGRTGYVGTTLNAGVSDVLSQIDWIEKVWKSKSE